MTKELYNKYKRHGFQMLLIGSDKKIAKRRIRKDKSIIKDSEPYNEDAFYAIVPSKKIMIIDVDIKNGKKGEESLQKLQDDLMIDLAPSVKTGSGGVHIYVYIDMPIHITQKQYPDIDFICHKADNRLCTPYAIAGGQIIEYEGSKYTYELIDDMIIINEVEGLGDLLTIDVLKTEANEDVISMDDIYDKKTPDEIKDLLKWLDSSEYTEWMANASAIRRELGNTEEAFEIFHDWSKTADNYADRDSCLAKWKNVKDYQGKPRTMATLYTNSVSSKSNQLINELNKSKNVESMENLINEDEWLQYPMLPHKFIINEISKTYMSKVHRLNETITYNEAQKKTKILYGKEFSETNSEDIKVKDNAFDDFVKVASFKGLQYFQISNGSKHDVEGVSRELNKALMRLSRKNGLKKTMTVQQAFQKKFIKYANSHEYNPSTNDRLFINDEKQTVLNMFNYKTVPDATPFTPKGKILIDKFVKHLELITTKKEADILIKWMAYIAQNPGKKILWVPLIQSVEGIGKTIIGSLLIYHVFGKSNAGIVDSIIVADSNNSWACSKMLRVLEEIKLSGHNRYEVLNQLKPLITNPMITRKEKFEVSSDVVNTCNFIAFTNFKDALPLDDEDRRWWIVFSSVNSLKELKEKCGKDLEEYFAPLHELSIKSSPYGTEFRTFLLEQDLSKFSWKFAPDSTHKEELIDMEKSKIQYIDETEDLIKYIYKKHQPKVIDLRLLREGCEMATNDYNKRIAPRGIPVKDLRSILKKLGYKNVMKKDYPDAEWSGLSPMFYHVSTVALNDAIEIWEQGFDVDFVANDFNNLDEEL